MPRRIKVDGIDCFFGRQVIHSGEAVPSAEGRRVIVIGDDEAALDTALALADSDIDRPASVTLMHRRDAFTASPATVDRMRAACAAGRMQFVAAQAIGCESAGDTLTQLVVARADGTTLSLPVDLLLVLWGLSPKLGPIADWGIQLDRKQVVVDTEKFETSVPRIFAVGDVNTYPGKKKLIVCGFHEATMAAYGAAAYLRPDRPVQVQYTTTSTRLHRLLGVAPDA